MLTNELGIEVPPAIFEKAKTHRCVGGVRCVYRDGEYGGRPPKASIGCERNVRFRGGRYDAFKVLLGDGWVAFRSPSGAGRPAQRVPGKGLCEPCVVCGEFRFGEKAHFPTPDRHGGTETIWLCPTHHRLLDNGRLSDAEWKLMWERKYSALAVASVEEFMKWASDRRYPYSRTSMCKKPIRVPSRGRHVISYVIENWDVVAAGSERISRVLSASEEEQSDINASC